MKFKEMTLSGQTLKALDSLNYFEATEVQEKTIPQILQGSDVMVRSKTGTGKTAAFGIPLIERITSGKTKKGLILAPTRELAIQICREIRLLAAFYRLRILVVYGGHGLEQEISELRKGVDILVATPGRLLDLSRRGAVALGDFDFVVVDEADRMLDMGFIEDINTIITATAKNRMTHFFSATLDENIYSIANRYISQPVVIEIGEKEKPSEIDEESVFLKRSEKFDKLTEILNKNRENKIIVFVSTQREVEYLNEKLVRLGYNTLPLHGGFSQPRRERTVKEYKERKSCTLIATDVAARGLDIKDIGIVINYDEAQDGETHLHRIGRTGRMGKKGRAISFIETDKNEHAERVAEYVDLSDYYKKGERPPQHLANQIKRARGYERRTHQTYQKGAYQKRRPHRTISHGNYRRQK